MTHRNSSSIVRYSSLLFSFIALSVSVKAFELTRAQPADTGEVHFQRVELQR